MRRVIVESPFAAADHPTLLENIYYARLALNDCLRRGEAPYASHLLYTQEHVLNDTDETDRALGIKAGLAWGHVADLIAVYEDRGISPGMLLSIEYHAAEGRKIIYRKIPNYGARS